MPYDHLPNANIKYERPKRKHQYEDFGHPADAPLVEGQLAMLVQQATGRAHLAPATAGAKCYPVVVGVTQAEIDSGKWPLIRKSGEAPVICAEAINAGDEVMSDANGHAVPHATAAYVAGFLQSAATVPSQKVALEAESYYY